MSEHTVNHEVISAFIDNEPFDPQALASALADPGGRDLLLDLIAMRHVVAADLTDEVRSSGVGRRAGWRVLATAASLIVAIGSGYLLGHRGAAPGPGPVAAAAVTPGTTAASDIAPAPTRVIDLKPGVDWHPTGGGH